MRCLRSLLPLGLLFSTLQVTAQQPKEPGLLFYLSGDHGFNADYAAGGDPVPNYLNDVKILPGGAKGSYLQCGNNQLLSYWAPGNIYAQRGTLSFYWRSRDPVDADGVSHLPRRLRRPLQLGSWSGCASTTTAMASMPLSPT